MKKSKQKTTTVIVIMFAIVIAVGIGFWTILEHGRNKTEEEALLQSDNKEVNALLNKDLSVNYPDTPKEVLKLYSRLQSCAYNQGLSDKELTAIIEKMRELFDEDLAATNPLDKQLEEIKKDIKSYQSAKRTISNYVVDNDSSVVERKIKDKEYATLEVSYLLKDEKGYTKTYEQFILRKDTEGKWKILGWELVKSQDEDEE